MELIDTSASSWVHEKCVWYDEYASVSVPHGFCGFKGKYWLVDTVTMQGLSEAQKAAAKKNARRQALYCMHLRGKLTEAAWLDTIDKA